jgi:hypothetical protein
LEYTRTSTKRANTKPTATAILALLFILDITIAIFGSTVEAIVTGPLVSYVKIAKVLEGFFGRTRGGAARGANIRNNGLRLKHQHIAFIGVAAEAPNAFPCNRRANLLTIVTTGNRLLNYHL